MTTVIHTKIMKTKRGARIWLQGIKLLRENIQIAMPFSLCADKNSLIGRFGQGERHVSKKKFNGHYIPVIDLENRQIENWAGSVSKVRVVIRSGMMKISLLPMCEKILEREARFKEHLSKGFLNVMSMCHGGGVLDRSLADGFAQEGIQLKTKVCIEMEDRYLDASLKNNPTFFDSESVIVEAPVEELNAYSYGKQSSQQLDIDIYVAGLPCVAASKAGISKNHLTRPEQHPLAGAVFFYALNWIIQTSAPVILLENVRDFLNTASFDVIKSVLQQHGYNLSYKVLNAMDYGSLENRHRMALIATSQNLPRMAFEQMQTCFEKPASLGSILEDIPEDSKEWKNHDYLAKKEERDKAAKKGFRRQLVNASSPYVGVIGHYYQKRRSCEPFVQHADNPNLSRLLTVSEVAKLNHTPPALVDGLSAARAYEILGQGVSYCTFLAVAKTFAKILKRHLFETPKLSLGVQ